VRNFGRLFNHVKPCEQCIEPLLAADELIETYDPNAGLVPGSEHPGLARIMQSLKGRSAYKCNKILWAQRTVLGARKLRQSDQTRQVGLNYLICAG
jgi:hypothetical protein